MKQKMSKEEMAYVKKLLESKPPTEQKPIKDWLDREIKVLLKKYGKQNKLF